MNIKVLFSFLVCSLSFLALHAQDVDADKALDKAKKELQSYEPGEVPDYFKAGQILEKIIATQPGNPEAWYFFGHAIDKYNAGDGEQFLKSSLPLAIRASEAFQNAVELSDSLYSGGKIIFDPHTRILNIWGIQALRYLNLGKKDSAVWCLQQAGQRGGINRTVLEYFRQQLDECTSASVLFTNGDMSVYYLQYLQAVEHFRRDVLCVDLNFLNTNWYFPLMVRDQGWNDSIAGAFVPKDNRLKWPDQIITIRNCRFPQEGNDSTISWQAKSPANGYMQRSDLILLNYLRWNQFKRDISFSADVPLSMRLSLSAQNYLQLRGLTYKLVTDTASSNLVFLESRLSRLPALPVDNKTYLDNPDNIQVLNNYRFAYTGAAVIASQKNNSEEALRLIFLVDRKYPETALPFFATATRDWYLQLKARAEKEQPLIW